jgi:hypothetical protein
MASHDNLARSSASDLLSVEGKTGDTPPTVFHTPSTEDPPVLVLNAPLTIPMSFSTSDPRTRLERSEASTPPSVVVPPAPAPSRSSDRDIVVPALPL